MTSKDQGASTASPPTGPAPFGLSPASGSQAEPLVPSAGHTPGPWAISEDGERVFATDCPVDGGDIVCEWPDAENSNARWPANARLIASAPELLEALLAVVRGNEQIAAHHKIDPREEAAAGSPMALAYAAIAKATIA